jgi:hypothetical protein
MPVIPATRQAVKERSQSDTNLGKVSWRPYLKNKLKTKQKGLRGADMDQVVEHLPSKHDALNSIPSTAKNNHYNLYTFTKLKSHYLTKFCFKKFFYSSHR